MHMHQGDHGAGEAGKPILFSDREAGKAGISTSNPTLEKIPFSL